VVRYVVSGLVAVVAISVLGVWLFSRAGEAEAIRDAKDQTRIAAEGSVEPVLTDGLVRGEPKALAAVDRVVQERILSDASIARVKTLLTMPSPSFFAPASAAGASASSVATMVAIPMNVSFCMNPPRGTRLVASSLPTGRSGSQWDIRPTAAGDGQEMPRSS
jgi:hypothetical protein